LHTFQTALNGNAGMNGLMRLIKPLLYHKGAVVSLADGSSTVRALRVKQACDVIQAHDIYGLRQHIGELRSDAEFVASFGKRLRMVLNGADKVPSICTAFTVSLLMVFGASTNCAHDRRTEKRVGASCELCWPATLRRTRNYRLLWIQSDTRKRCRCYVPDIRSGNQPTVTSQAPNQVSHLCPPTHTVRGP